MYWGDKRYGYGVQLCHEIHGWGAWHGAAWFKYYLLWFASRFNGYFEEPWTLWWMTIKLLFTLFAMNRIYLSLCHFVLVHLGFNVTSDACCGFGRYNGWIMCISPIMACKNASNHIWWDQFHPTDAVNAILADNVWNGLHTTMCYPKNLQDVINSKDWTIFWSDLFIHKAAPTHIPTQYLVPSTTFILPLSNIDRKQWHSDWCLFGNW